MIGFTKNAAYPIKSILVYFLLSDVISHPTPDNPVNIMVIPLAISDAGINQFNVLQMEGISARG
jgi:hypothetical protein